MQTMYPRCTDPDLFLDTLQRLGDGKPIFEWEKNYCKYCKSEMCAHHGDMVSQSRIEKMKKKLSFFNA